MFGVWGENGVGVAESPSKDKAQEGSRRDEALGEHGSRRISTNLQDRFPIGRGPKELSHQRLSGKGSDTDGNAGPLPIPACQRHRDNPGGGQPTPPTFSLVQHDGALEGVKREAYNHHSVCQWA